MHKLSYLVAATGLLAQLALAQSPDTTQLDAASLRVGLHTAAMEEDGSHYGTWAVGRDFKASFHDGFVFVPYLGKSYPENQSFRWTTTSIRVGQKELLGPVDRTGNAIGDWRFVYDLGVAEEIYDISAEHVEQSFRFTKRPITFGDLVVTGTVRSPLRVTARGAEHAALTFTDTAGHAVVRYGAAIAIDARGNTLPITSSANGEGQIVLRVPAAWIEQAQFPIVIDPIVSNVRIGRTTTPQEGPEGAEIVRDDATNTVLVAWTRSASATDTDLFATLYSDRFTTRLATVFTDATSSWSTTYPAATYVHAVRHWTVAFQRHLTGFVRVRVHAQDTSNRATLTSVRGVPTPTGHSEMHPDLGGVISGRAGGEAMLVTTRTTTTSTEHGEIWKCLIDPRTIAFSGQERVVTSIPSTVLQKFPGINSDGGGVNDGWVVVWQEYDQAIPGDDWDMRAVRLNSNGTRASTRTYEFSQNNQRDRHSIRPVIAGHDGRFGIGYVSAEKSRVSKPLELERGDVMRFEAIQWPRTQLHALRLGNAWQHQRPSVQWVVEDVCFDDNVDTFWGMVWRNVITGELSVSRHGYDGVELEKHILVPGVNEFGSAGSVFFDNDTDRYYVHYARTYQSGARHDWYGSSWTYAKRGTSTLAGSGCAGRMGYTGMPMHGSDTFAIDLSTVDANSFAVLYLGVNESTGLPLDTLGMPGCVWNLDLGSMLFAVPMPTNGNGFASFPLPLPGTLNWQGTLRAQWLFGRSGLNAAGLGTSRRLDFTIAR